MKLLVQRSKVKLCVRKIPMKWAHWVGSPGSSHASEAGIVITNHQAQRPCKEDGTNSPPWQAAMLLRWLNKMYESRSPSGEGCSLLASSAQSGRVDPRSNSQNQCVEKLSGSPPHV